MSLKLPNSQPVTLLGPAGPAHRVTRDKSMTLCVKPTKTARETTYAAVHVYLGGAFCLECFPEGARWP